MATVSTQPSRTEPTAVGAIDAARKALVEEVGRADVGAHLGHLVEGEPGGTVVTHLFACQRAGYVGWHWSVTLAQIPGEAPTVDEVVLIPGDEAIVAPAWVPYRDRIEPGDLSPGDLLPVSDEDPRLVPTYSFGDDPLDADAKAQVRQVAEDLGLGRVRTLSVEGLDLAAQRWYAGLAGPAAPIAQAAPHHCYSCGFLLRISGSLSAGFGVCANGDANDDGRVVSMDHGCGAHSEVRLAKKHEPLPLPEPVVDDLTTDLLEAF
ncbi:Protein of unknown function [Nocardioides terrae]|uniref:DUF3027 domain-containing protein n=1 Tax=Nocardioides terrae TaxID=574651 RepID=A0A1I1MTE1_9ACTN|nr:DUF3027 domain-containing protein [Nocardioides terrae]SFC88405.1 Protein of unknown function [Nocardioides terrae]